MKTYTNKNGVFLIGGACIPSDPNNTDYARMLTEVAAGTAEIVDYVPPSPTWDEIRAKRNELLAETDWMATKDRTMTQAEKAYRKALRDIPDTFQTPDDVVWPVKP